jgi:predicted nucleic acid-binding protein
VNEFVLDASAVLAWVLDEDREIADQVDTALNAPAESTRRVPAIFVAEVANALRTAVRRARLTAAQAQQAARIVDALALQIDSGAQVTGALLSIAIAHDLTAYDALYLELAMRSGARLVTQDAALRAAAIRAGVPV